MADEGKRRQEIGERLRKAREYLELTQDEAAKAVGVSRPTLSQIENGHRKVDAVELAKFGEVYGQSVEAFTGTTDPIPADVQHLARATRGLSDQDRNELFRFAEYLQARAKKE